MSLLVALFLGLRSVTVQGEGELDTSTLFLSCFCTGILPEPPPSMVLSKDALHTQTTVAKKAFLLCHILVILFHHTSWKSTFGTASMESYYHSGRLDHLVVTQTEKC